VRLRNCRFSLVSVIDNIIPATDCHVCAEPMERSAVLCSKCTLIVHPRCATHAAQTCDLRLKRPTLAQPTQRGGPTDTIAPLLPPAVPASHGSRTRPSRVSLDCERVTPRTSVSSPAQHSRKQRAFSWFKRSSNSFPSGSHPSDSLESLSSVPLLPVPQHANSSVL
jgi:hypothetical protein